MDKQTPFHRFHNDSAKLRFPPDHEDLKQRFVLTISRRVSNDHIVPVASVSYEMPRGYAGARVLLYRRLLTDTVHFIHGGRLIRLHPVDLALNAASPRAKASKKDDVDKPLPPSAADMAFNRDLKPVVGPDGGFTEQNDQEDN